ncbi:hypothetical protein HOLleu_10573 [Holothuria leucospilota]|uniref:Uncharacterized protein n=1 Tax=Holothuria leucospilota TaxID=206669 RepID=A0A9Q1CF12_HOLLE|nr:hypothetical protein HOLleu_10573 [Holothuria leucospilota]
MPNKWVLAVLDFAENYVCFYQNEAQGAYWTHNQVTIHPVVTSYKCGECPATVTECIIIISPDNKHDHDEVHAYMDLVSIHLQQKRALQVDTTVRFSDGCACQYKSRGPLAEIAMPKKDYGFTTCHNYYGTRHGKGPSDCEAAVVKSKASTAIKCGVAVISDARSLYNYCTEALTKDLQNDKFLHFRRSFYFVEDVPRGRPRSHIKTVAGTRSFDSVLTGEKENSIKVLELSCFCVACITRHGKRTNTSYVRDWKEVILHRSVPLEVDKVSDQINEQLMNTYENGKAHEDEDGASDDDDDGCCTVEINVTSEAAKSDSGGIYDKNGDKLMIAEVMKAQV